MPCLLKKAGDTNAFISDQGKKALSALCLNCSEVKTFHALENFIENKNPAIKQQVAKSCGHLVSKLKSKVKTFKDSRHLIDTMTKYLSDANQQVRENSKETFAIML